MKFDAETCEKLQKKGLLFYSDWDCLIQSLPDAEAGKLLKALYQFSHDYQTKKALDDPTTNAIYQFFSSRMRADAEKWLQTCEKRAQAAYKSHKKTEEGDNE